MRLRGLLEALPGVTAIAVLGLGLLTLFLGHGWFWMVFVLGFAVVVPLVAILSDALVADEPAAADELPEEDALAVLRDRYARGEIDEAELERRLDALLETGTLDDAREWVTADRDRSGDRESDLEAERA